MKKVFICIAVLLCVNIASADIFGTGANQFSIDFVDISGDTGDLGSWPAGNRYTFSGVNHGDYRMGTYEVTNDQWTKFKNEYGTVTGSPTSAYDENPYWTGTNVPTNHLSWHEGAQFVNYLNTSTGHQAAYKFTGTQGTGDYTLGVWESGDDGYDVSNPFRNSNAYYFMPTADEWVKAAYWNGTSLQTYSTIGDLIPIAGVDTNYDDVIGSPWDVGSGSEELNGTFDMMGNVWEWMESPTYSGDYLPSSMRGWRGGSFYFVGIVIRSSNRGTASPNSEHDYFGFRVASVVPEPTTTPPIADAGDDITTYAGPDGIAVVILDGSGSFDPDGNALEYSWYEGDELIAGGVSPTVELGAGDHVIELIVNDGMEDSEPDEVVVTVIAPVEVSMMFTPQAVNLYSKGRWVIGHIVLPTGYGVDDVDVGAGARLEPFGVDSHHVDVFVNDDGLVEVEAVFERGLLRGDVVNGETVEVVVSGRFVSGQWFYGIDTVKITRMLEHFGMIALHWLEGDCGVPDWCGGADVDGSGVVDVGDLIVNE